MPRPLRILIVSAEVAPIADTGELGRSVGGLSKALKSLGVDVRVVMPKYRGMKSSNVFGLTRLVPKMRIRTLNRFGDLAIWRDELPGEVPVYLIEKDKYFDRDYIYGPPETGFEDNAERFGFFNLAALEMFMQIGFYPNVIHCHDWHTGLIPAYLETIFRQDPLHNQITTVFTVHDLIHQGCFTREEMSVTGLPESIYNAEGIEFYGRFSFLKAGLRYADILTTESKRYSREIQTGEYGRGFEGIFQERNKDLYGIVNGVEYKKYDPRIDPHIMTNYTKDEVEKKGECKLDVFEKCGFDDRMDIPLIGMISQVDEEKGVDVLLNALERMMRLPLRFVFLNEDSRSNEVYRSALTAFEEKYQAMKCFLTPDEATKHKILAGADMLLMPSKSEPGGFMQLYALKYGTIPLVHATGGLDDTIFEFQADSGKGTGFKFSEDTPEALLAALDEALQVYRNKSLWDLLQANAMRVDFSWVYTAKKYVDIYKQAMSRAKMTSEV